MEEPNTGNGSTGNGSTGNGSTDNGASVENQEVIDDDIRHTVGSLFHVRPQHNNLTRGRKEGIEEIVKKALQAERNHWKHRLHMSMQEIDRHHKVVLATQTGLQELVRSLRYTLQRNVILEENDDDEEEDLDNATVATRLMENLKFQVRQLKMKAGLGTTAKTEYEEAQLKQRSQISELKDRLRQMTKERDNLDIQLSASTQQISSLQRENTSLHKQLIKLQKIVQKYNENHSGANFHLDAPSTADKRNSLTTLELSNGSSTLRERTYIEGDQLVSYPTPIEENAIIKDRLRKNIYSARKGDSRSSNVAQCLRCQSLFKPAENTHRSCRFHHKGREIKEHFDSHGKLEKVMYKWACCKKTLETAGCCYGYHV